MYILGIHKNTHTNTFVMLMGMGLCCIYVCTTNYNSEIELTKNQLIFNHYKLDSLRTIQTT